MTESRRIVVLGRGGAGKSTFAKRIARENGLLSIELDAMFWKPGATPTPPEDWIVLQNELTAGESWVVDGDLGPYDTALESRLAAADAVVILNFALWRCVWQAARRGHESREFWSWVISYRRRSLPMILASMSSSGCTARVFCVRGPAKLDVVANAISSI